MRTNWKKTSIHNTIRFIFVIFRLNYWIQVADDKMTFLINVSILLGIGFPVVAYIWAKYINSYWVRKNVPHIPAKVFLGNMTELVTFRQCAAEQFTAFYNHKVARDQSVVGVHIFHKPALVLRDPELIKRVLVQDFNSFSNRYKLRRLGRIV